ncbi:hypothetical protein [Burkholderia gladioli]|uniref:hypothetical protein n=1 Tax=Burkholderia gladioli TaxID=28095 RepID=UPI001364C980|nr:hypothetical protein [Burkholderia gladioli]
MSAIERQEWGHVRGVIVAMLLAIAPFSASAFDVDGFRTSMSVSQVEDIARGQGWALSASTLVTGVYIEAHYGPDGKVTELGPANFSFCRGRLVAYTRELDFDTEYVTQLRDMVAKYGSQPTIEVRQQAWSGPGGGYISTVATKWPVGREQAEISFTPEGHTGNGLLKNYRSAHVAYVIPGQCPAR